MVNYFSEESKIDSLLRIEEKQNQTIIQRNKLKTMVSTIKEKNRMFETV